MRFTPRDADGNWIVVHVSPTGLREWADYIPVQEVSDVAGAEYRYDEDGHIPMVIVAGTGQTAWVDYTPIDIVTSRTGRWRIEATGFIPVVDNTPP